MPKEPTAKLPLTLEQYAEERKLPLDYLVNVWGLKNVVREGVACIEQPYTRMDGEVCAPRYRYANAKQSPPNSGEHIILYGQKQLISPEGSTFILPEGESDTQTLHHARYNVLGIPGTSMWDKCISNDPAIVDFLAFKTVIIIQEPPSLAEKAKGLDSAAKMVMKIKASLPLSTVVAVKLWEFAPRDSDGEPLYKDVSGLWLYHAGLPGWDKSLHFASRSAGKKASVPQRSIELIRASSVPMKLTRWLWPNRIPLNKVSVFSGMAERGKSTVAADFISRLTRGVDFPDAENTTEPCEVLVLASEEDYDEDICPRLTAAGADMDRVFFTERSTVDGNDSWPIALDRDLSLLHDKLATHPNIKLIVVDPVTSYVGNVDPSKPKEVRPFIDKLKVFSKQAQVSILLIMHFSKNPDVSAIHKTSGAATWTDAPRAVWMFDKKKDEDDSSVPRTHVMVVGKLNKKAADQRKTLEFCFGSVPVLIEGKTEEVGAIIWGQETDLTMDQQFKNEDRQKPGPEPKKTEAAMGFLQTYLAGGEQLATDTFAAGAGAGHSAKTLREAQRRLEIIPHRETSGKHRSLWSLPVQSVQSDY